MMYYVYYICMIHAQQIAAKASKLILNTHQLHPANVFIEKF